VPTESDVRLTFDGGPLRHLTVPEHDLLRVGTRASMLDDVAQARGIHRQLFDCWSEVQSADVAAAERGAAIRWFRTTLRGKGSEAQST
jgi:hypothetical protein